VYSAVEYSSFTADTEKLSIYTVPEKITSPDVPVVKVTACDVFAFHLEVSVYKSSCVVPSLSNNDVLHEIEYDC